MVLKHQVNLILFLLVVSGNLISGQEPPPPASNAAALLQAALKYHCGSPGKADLKTMFFTGQVGTRTREGDVNDLDAAQWFEIKKGKDTLHTRIEVKTPGGQPKIVIRGFDGKHYFVITRRGKTIIDGNPDHKETVQNIKQDLDRTRFIIDAFILGNIVGRESVLKYLKKGKDYGLDYHKILRKAPGQEDCIFYVNARQGEDPFFHGIEFPRRMEREKPTGKLIQVLPKRNLCFGRMKQYGSYHIPQDIRIHHNDSEKPNISIWIFKLEVNGKRAAWVR